MVNDKWYSKSFRRHLVDMHIEKWHGDFLSEFNEEKYYNCLEIARIQSTMIPVQSHVGLCNWDSKSGEVHPAFKDNFKIKKLIDKCHNAGMDVITYYSLIYNNWAYDKFPSWRMKNVYGNASRDHGNRYGLCCPNNTEYRQFVSAQMEEFCGCFDFEGIFLDMTFWPMVCYCDSCKKRWEQEAGGEMPTVVDWSDPDWLKFQKKREEWLGEFARFATSGIKKHKPDCAVEHQTGPLLYFWRLGVTEEIAQANDYVGGDLYGGAAQQSFGCKMFYGISKDQPFEYMTSRCYPELREHTTNKTQDQLELSVYATYAHHGACMLIDAIDPRGTLDVRLYDTIGKIFGESRKYEKYLKGELVQDVGVYYSLRSKMDVGQTPVYVGMKAADDQTQPHFKAAIGAVNSLRSHHVPVGVLNNWKLEDFSKVKVIVLPDVQFMCDRELQAVREFVGNGGKLYMSGHTAPGLAEDIFGLKFEGFTDESVTYIAPTCEGEKYLEGFTAEYPMMFLDKQVKMSGIPKGEVLGTITLPYTIPDISDCQSDYNDIASKKENVCMTNVFAAIHSNPPGIPTEYPAIIKAGYGKGTVIWSSVPIEAPERYQHSEVFSKLIKDLLDEASYYSDNAAEVVEFVLFSDDDGNTKYVNMINLQESFNVIDVHDFDVYIKTYSRPKAVKVLPDESGLAFEYADGYTKIHIDKLHIFEMIALEM